MPIVDATQFSIDFFTALSELIQADARMRRDFVQLTRSDRPVLRGQIDTQKVLVLLQGIEQNVQKRCPEFHLSPAIARVGDAFEVRQICEWVLQIAMSGPAQFVHGHSGIRMTAQHYGQCYSCLAMLLKGPISMFFSKFHTGK